jgi:hypothetical protein
MKNNHKIESPLYIYNFIVIFVFFVTAPTLPRAVGVTEQKITVTPCDAPVTGKIIACAARVMC